MSSRVKVGSVAGERIGFVTSLLVALLSLPACDAENMSMRPDGDDTVFSPDNNLTDAGTVTNSGDMLVDSGAPPALPPGQRYQVGGGLGVGTVAGGVLMTSERYQLFGATGQSPANQIKSTTERFYLRSGVVGVTP